MLFRITVPPLDVDAADPRDAIRQAILSYRNSPHVEVSTVDDQPSELESDPGTAQPPLQTLAGHEFALDVEPHHWHHGSGMRGRSYGVTLRRRTDSRESAGIWIPQSEIDDLIALLQSAQREIQQRHDLHW